MPFKTLIVSVMLLACSGCLSHNECESYELEDLVGVWKSHEAKGGLLISVNEGQVVLTDIGQFQADGTFSVATCPSFLEESMVRDSVQILGMGGESIVYLELCHTSLKLGNSTFHRVSR